ncbi:MAG: type VI secretion system amidase effector protein Tae4 [Flavobacteriaceae bacterium]|jgi:hypothetical protein|nr:type VI secretion system amidase effector protein Tae4 [Flavobacteriaceae bacterium]
MNNKNNRNIPESNDQGESSEGVTVPPITVTRPKWDTMHENYPGTNIKTFDLYKDIGGKTLSPYDTPEKLYDSPYINSCAIRMSRGLNLSGIKLPSSDANHRDKGGTNGVLKGKDGNNYWFRVKPLGAYIKFLFGNPDKKILLKTAKVGETKQKMSDKDWADIKSKKGIIMFQVSGWGDATGHFTLWDGAHLVYPGDSQHDDYDNELYYFHMKYEREANGKRVIIQTNEILLWELK